MIKQLATVLILFVFNLNAQELNTQTVHKCFSDEFLMEQILANPDIQKRMDEKDHQIQDYLKNNKKNGFLTGKSNANLIIPVAVFVVHNNGLENITDIQVISQINALNTYFDPYGIQFCLATKKGSQDLTTINSPSGITSTTPGIFHYQDFFLTEHNVTAQSALTATGNALSSEKYLKIWVVKSIKSNTLPPSSKILGYSMLPQFATPNMDGIVMSYDAFGDLASCACTTLDPISQTGRILVHEVGHYLGLYHTFQGSCSGMSINTCETEGDRVCDTPPVAAPNNGCPPPYWNTCNESPDLPDNIHNFMDYVSETCMTEFTQGQENRMFANINLYRSNLVSSSNIVYTGINCNGGLLANFTADNFVPCVGNSVNFSAVAANGATYTWDFGDGTVGTGQNVSHVYTNVYMPATVILTVSNSTNTVSSTQLIYVDSCLPLNSTEGNWFFSLYGGLNFNTGNPVYANGAYQNLNQIDEASATQSDSQGNLLFYTNGEKVWDKNHQQINSTLMLGGLSSHHGTIIVPNPANASEYYIFTKNDWFWSNGVLTADTAGYNYSIVSVNSNNQASTTPIWNVPITMPSNYGYNSGQNNAIIGGEGITAIKSCDGYWIISTGLKGTSRYLIIHSLTANGLVFHSEQPSVYSISQQAFDVSQDGTKIAIGSGTIGSNGPAGVSIYDFDTYTGTLSNPIELSTTEVYGLSFSPDGKLFYTSSWNVSGLMQYDLEATNPGSTEKFVAAQSGANEIQRGPDNKLYMTRSGSSTVQVIHSPNNKCTTSNPNACDFSQSGPQMQSNMIWGGLPNMIDARTETVFPNVISHDQISCLTYTFEASICSGTFAWNFGDPNSGANNTSAQSAPSHTFSSPGTYVINVFGNGTTLTDTIEIGIQSVIQGSSTICIQANSLGNYSTNLQPGQSATWSVTGGGIAGLPNQTDLFVSWVTLPGTVTLTVTDNITFCSSTSSFTVVENCVGLEISDNTLDGYKIFPNPSSGTLNIVFPKYSSEKIQVSMKTIEGKVISDFSLESSTKQLEYDIPSTFKNGLLFIEIIIDGKKINEKIVVLR